jgi:drug/metabolite transporter (DMT)-like permease
VIALAAALSYATSGIAAKRGMRYSTPITVTLISLSVHAVSLWLAVFFTHGVPKVSPLALFLFILTGTLQPVIRLFTYAGIFYVGASRGTTLRGSHPLFSTSIAILFLGERATFWVIAGTTLIVAGIALISLQPESRNTSFRWWHIGFPLAAALLAGISHPLRRYALILADEPLFFAAVVGLVSWIWMVAYLLLPVSNERPVWNQKSIGWFLVAAGFETLGILLVITALSIGRVVIVSPIVATSPLWVLVGTWLFLRGIENLTPRIVLGALCVVFGTIAISVAR